MKKFTHLIFLGLSYKLKLIKPWNYPYQITIEPTNVCNYKCVFCPQSDPDHELTREQGFLTTENMRLFLKRIRNITTGNKNISLTLDGEPTLNKELPEFIKLINAEGLFPRFSSNAKKLKPELVDKLAATGPFSVSIDFASEPKYFDNVRGKKGDFDLVFENLRYLIESSKKNPRIKLEIVNISHFSGANLDKTLRAMRKLFSNDLPGNITFRSRDFHNFCGHLGDNDKKHYSLCPYPWTMLAVTWNGDVVPCCRDTRARTVLGNVFCQSIQEIWYGKTYQDLRTKLIKKNVDNIGACGDCDLPWTYRTPIWKTKYIYSLLSWR